MSIVLWSAFAPAFLSAADSTPVQQMPPEVAVLEEAVTTWLRDVTFFCHYRVRAGYARTLDEALQGKFDESNRERSSSSFSGGGILCKDGKKIRQSMNYDGGWVELTPPPEIQGTGSGKSGANVSFDEMTDDLVEIQYEPHDRGVGGGIKFWERSLYPFGGTAAAGVDAVKFPCPLAPLAQYGKPMLSFEPIALSGRPVRPWRSEASISQPDAEHLEVRVVGQQAERGDGERRVTFWTKPAPPVVTRIELTGKSAAGPYASTYVTLSDFVECPGGMVARRVVYVYQYPPPGAILLKVWDSNDLGLRPCELADFTIEVERTTSFGGLSHPVKFKRPLHVALDEITPSDLGSKVYRASEVFDLPDASDSRADGAPRTTAVERWLVLGAVFVALLLAAFGALRARRHTKPPGAEPLTLKD